MSLEPIVHVLDLRCPPARAFEAFARLGAWWDPRYTSSADTLDTVVLEPRRGGRVYERHRDGHEVDWGRITRWEPPHRLAYSSHLAQPPEHPSEVSVAFEPAPAGGTTVRFEHGGWTAENADHRARFREWPLLLRRMAALAEQ